MKLSFSPLDVAAFLGFGALLAGLALFDYRWAVVGGGGLLLTGAFLFGRK